MSNLPNSEPPNERAFAATVTLWGRQAPPIGGVTRSVEGMSTALTKCGWSVTVIDLRKERSFRTIAKHMADHRGPKVYHASGPSSVIKYLPLAILDRGRKALFLHAAEGGTTKVVRFPFGLKTALRRFDRIWVTNEALARHIQQATSTAVRLASPYSGVSGSNDSQDQRRGHRYLSFAHNGHPLYGSQLAVEVVGELRRLGHDATLLIVTYGNEPRGGDWDKLQSRRSEAPWLEVIPNETDISTSALLQGVDTLLRLTTTDGDSMVVREALSQGLRVLASDEVPRPAGVELTGLKIMDAVDAALHGGPISSGEGLGNPIVEEFLAWARPRTQPDLDR